MPRIDFSIADVSSIAGRPPASQATPRAAERPAPVEHRSALPRISCVIPCRNEARNLVQLLPELTQMLSGLAEHFEVVLVDDGSTDESPALMQAWAQRPGIRVLQLSRNFGKEAALTAGLEAARGDVVVLMDADLQHPPSLIPAMLARWREGADVVYACRHDRRDESALKRLGTRAFYRLVNLGDRFHLPEGAGDFRLLDRTAVDALLALPERNRFMKGLYAWIGFKAVALPYEPPPRASGRSHFSLWGLFRFSVNGLTAFTTWPLRAVTVVGLVMAVFGFGYGSYLSIDYLLFGHPLPGWTTIVVTLLFFFGVQMISLGIMGEYIARIHEEVKGRPLYIVRQALGSGLIDSNP
jgi:glycosyltransferase involved in cell wall biosynthesis